MKDGNIYSWRWKDTDKHRDCGPYRSYHCYSKIAVAKDGKLFDTYWGDWSKELSLENINVVLLGNPSDMKTIREYDIHYYKDSDIVDTRHPNSSSAPIYLRNGAKRDEKVMLDYVNRQIEENRRDAESAKRSIERFSDMKQQIIDGDLEEVYF